MKRSNQSAKSAWRFRVEISKDKGQPATQREHSLYVLLTSLKQNQGKTENSQDGEKGQLEILAAAKKTVEMPEVFRGGHHHNEEKRYEQQQTTASRVHLRQQTTMRSACHEFLYQIHSLSRFILRRLVLRHLFYVAAEFQVSLYEFHSGNASKLKPDPWPSIVNTEGSIQVNTKQLACPPSNKLLTSKNPFTWEYEINA